MYAAQCTRSLGSIQLAQDNLPAAEIELQSAMSEFEAIGHALGAVQCGKFLGDVRIRQGEYDSAEQLLVSVKEVCVQLGTQSDLANCHWSFGRYMVTKAEPWRRLRALKLRGTSMGS
ncbi:hypothetical protein BKA62DRAFT_122447 [Auriculariales sp. MPI-PUGE-AT-0066]|nr:hypothetical protein BKA62DRAFT_122447 [Auriculariales sp. MPI-PUGE-AT-0066]